MSNLPQTQQPRELSQADAFRSSLNKMNDQIKASLPAHVPVDRFIRVVMTAVQKTPKLLEANKASLFAACLDSAKDGLLPDGREAALVPYGDKVTYLPMVGGILKKIRNSGELSSISPHVVYENDEFDYYTDEKGEHLRHRPTFKDAGKVILAYCVCLTKDGGVYIEIMTISQIEAIRKRSKSSGSGPWVTDWEEMAKKTVIRRLAKRLPMSTDIDEMMFQDDERQGLHETTPPPAQDSTTPVGATATAPKKSKLATAMEAKTSPVTPKPAITPKEAPVETEAEYQARMNRLRDEPMDMNMGSDEVPI